MIETITKLTIPEMMAIIAFITSLVALSISRTQLRNAQLNSLFSGFDQANDELMRKPELLIAVHGVDSGTKELESIVYLGILIDAFHHYWGKKYNDDYFEAVYREPSNFLHKIVAVEANYERWKILRDINYGADDGNFISVMNELFEDAQKSRDKSNK